MNTTLIEREIEAFPNVSNMVCMSYEIQETVLRSFDLNSLGLLAIQYREEGKTREELKATIMERYNNYIANGLEVWNYLTSLLPPRFEHVRLYKEHIERGFNVVPLKNITNVI